MQNFDNYQQLMQIVNQLHDRSFDDTEVTYGSHFDNTLEIRFIVDGKTPENRTIIDDDGEERLVFNRLLIRNVTSFDIETPDDGSPHRIVDIERVDDNCLRFVLTHARWLAKFDGNITGEYGEQIDDTDFSLEVSMRALLVAAAIVIGSIVGIFKFWL
jgi:hypothetical protein